MKVVDFPLSKISICFVIGVLLASFTKISFEFTLPFLIPILGLSTFFYFKAKSSKIYSFSFGFLVLLLAFLIGFSNLRLHDETQQKNHYIHHVSNIDENHSFEFQVLEKLKNTKKNTRYIVAITKKDKEITIGKVILNVKKHKDTSAISVGNIGLVYGSIFKNRKPNNPLQFDYGKYLEKKQIYGQIYTDKSKIKLSPIFNKDIAYYTSKFRNNVNANLKEKGFDKKALAVLNALVLGQRQEITPEVLREYQFAGAIHILAVSGLHVGLLLIFVNLLLRPISNTLKGRLLKLGTTLLLLWTFGCIAGLTPSVFRSVLMFSIVSIGMYWRRGTNIYHTLLVSMLLILFINPYMLFDMGFQLSYIALFSIIWIQPLFKNIWEPKIKIISYFWEILTVSIAAQIGTLPISIYYFHQFPGLFFITNLIIIPSLTLILGLGIIVVIMASLSFVPKLPMMILEKSIQLMNLIISKIASFESFILKDISMNKYMMMSVYLLLIFFVAWLKTPKYKNLYYVFCSILIFQISTFYTKYTTQIEKEFVVFNLQKNSLFAERIGKNATIYANDSILENFEKDVTLKSYLVGNYCQLKSKKTITNLLYFEGKKILVIDSSATYPNNIQPDLVIIRQAPKLNLERFLKECKPKTIVCDASNFKTYVNRWKETCSKRKIPFHSTYEKGFYALKID